MQIILEILLKELIDNLPILNHGVNLELMEVVAVAGLAQNFAALRSLTTTGIQEGHMKMHLNNIMNQFQVTAEERSLVKKYFNTKAVAHSTVVDFIENLRKFYWHRLGGKT